MPADRAPLIDRVVTRLGAGAAIRGQPGLGWMLVEVIPVRVWILLTGAFTFESAYFLEAYLSKLGLPQDRLWWMPFAHYLGTMIHLGVVIWLHGRGDVRRLCLWFTLLGRLVWMGIVAWPLLAIAAGWSPTTIHLGVLTCLAASQILMLTGASLWASWTQAIIPASHRGPFFAWRQFASLTAMLISLALLTVWWPDPGAGGADDLGYLTAIFAGAGIASLLSMGFLVKAPDLPPTAQSAAPSRSLRTAVRERPLFARYLAWFAVITAANACTLTWLRPLVSDLGVTDRTYATLEYSCRTPAMFVGFLIAGAIMWRRGSGLLLKSMNLLAVVWVGLLLSLTTATASWQLPIAMTVDGLARGLYGVAFLSHLHHVIAERDARFPALLIAAGGAAGMLAAIGQHLIGGLAPADTAAWWMIAGGGVLYLIAWPWLLGQHGDRRGDVAPHTAPPSSAP